MQAKDKKFYLNIRELVDKQSSKPMESREASKSPLRVDPNLQRNFSTQEQTPPKLNKQSSNVINDMHFNPPRVVKPPRE